jgi:hypothetical protein
MIDVKKKTGTRRPGISPRRMKLTCNRILNLVSMNVSAAMPP